MVSPAYMGSYGTPVPSSCDALIVDHTYLCRRGARKFWRVGLERNDLEQVASIGLIKAARRFDASTRTPFEAYAWLIIVGELMHHVRDHERTVRVPRRLQTLGRRVDRERDALLGALGREPSDVELAERLGVTIPVVGELRRVRSAAVVARIDETAALDIVQATTFALEDRILVDGAFAALTQQERYVIAGVYVLGLTQLEIARRLDVSAKRISRVHQGALRRLQRACAS